MDEAKNRITSLEEKLEKKRKDLEQQDNNLASTLALVQQLAEENVKSEDEWYEEKAYLTKQVSDLEAKVIISEKNVIFLCLMLTFNA